MHFIFIDLPKNLHDVIQLILTYMDGGPVVQKYKNWMQKRLYTSHADIHVDPEAEDKILY